MACTGSGNRGWLHNLSDLVHPCYGNDSDVCKLSRGRGAQLQSPIKALMNDVTLLAKNPEEIDDVLERLNVLVAWSRMKFKSKKSRSLTFRSGKQIQQRFKIGGDHIPTVKEEPVKSLGRLYAGSLTDRHEGVLIQKQAEGGLASIENSQLTREVQNVVPKIWTLPMSGLAPLDLQCCTVQS